MGFFFLFAEKEKQKQMDSVLEALTSSLGVHAQLSLLAGLATYHFIPAVASLFLDAGFSGKDMAKRAAPVM